MAVCYRHPGRETGVSCSNCGNPICPDCMTATPVGMRCPDCSRQKTPVRTLRNVYAQPTVTYVLIAINVLLYFGTMLSGGRGGEVYDDFVSEFVDYTRSLRVGDPLDESTDLGPMVSAPQRAKVEAQLEAAVSAGATLVVGGDRAGFERGHFLSPAVVTGASDTTELLREETFGPVAPIVPVDSLDEAIRHAR